MKKILVTATIILSTASMGVYAGFNSSGYNWNGGAQKAMSKPMVSKAVVQNTMIAHRYDRNNSVSVADIQKISRK